MATTRANIFLWVRKARKGWYEVKRRRLGIRIGKVDGIWSATIAALRVRVHVHVIQGLEWIFSCR